MTLSRAEQIDLSATSFYHCVTRCVRRSFLCGRDAETGKDFSHRKEWIVARIKHLTKSFALEIAAYSVMDNHYHVTLCVNETEAVSWSEEEVKSRWAKLFWRDAKKTEDQSFTKEQTAEKIALWRSRLIDISWFMRCLNEYIARLCNKEDGVTGRFWESRFKCQALLDEGAVLTAMAYVDLNPIRAKMASTPEESKYTSIHERIKWVKKSLDKSGKLLKNIKRSLKESINQSPQPTLLMHFDNGISHCGRKTKIDFLLSDYLALVDETGRIIREDKHGAISESLSPILTRLQLKPQYWREMFQGLQHKFAYAIGSASRLSNFSSVKSKARSLKGAGLAKKCYLVII